MSENMCTYLQGWYSVEIEIDDHHLESWNCSTEFASEELWGLFSSKPYINFGLFFEHDFSENFEVR